jgi:hypothetical protein
LLDTGEPQHATFARPNTPASLLDNIFSHAAAEATLVDIDHTGSPSDHAFVVADLPAGGIDISCAGEPDPAHTIRFNHLRRPCLLRKIFSLSRSYRSASLDLINIDMAQLNDELLAAARATLGTHPPRPPLRKPWMGDACLTLKRQIKRLVLSTGFRQYRSLLRRAEKVFRRARSRAQRLALASLLHQVEDGDMDVFYGLLKAGRNRKGGGGSAPRFTPHLDHDQASVQWGRVFAREAGSVDVADVAPYAATILIHFTPEEVMEAICKLRSSAPGPDGLEASLLLLGRKSLAPVLAEVFTRALADLPAALRHGLTVLLPKTVPPSGDPLAYRPITLLPVLVAAVPQGH